MSNSNHIKRLQSVISKFEKELAFKWGGETPKSAKIRTIQKKINSLSKSH
jgi:hypothetical protein